jgi:hypothetical protein
MGIIDDSVPPGVYDVGWRRGAHEICGSGDDREVRHMNDEIGTRGRRFTLKGWHVILAAVILFVGGIGLHIAIHRGGTERRIEALRAAGYPTSFAELTEYTKLPEGARNAAEMYTHAFAVFVPPPDEANVPILGKARLPDRGVPLPESMVKAISECLAANRECLALLHEAAGIEHCRYDWDYPDRLVPWKTPPHWDGVKRCEWLLHLSMIFHAHAGDTEATVTCIRDALRLAESERREPGMIGYTIRLATRAAALSGLESALNRTAFTDPQLTELDEMLATSIATLGLKEALITERCFAIEEFKAMQRWKRPPLADLIRTREAILWIPGIRGRGLPEVLDYMEGCIEAADLPVAQGVARFREIEKELAGLSVLHAMAKACAPVGTRRAFELNPRIHSHFDLARTALAIERYRLATGEVPSQLETLVPRYLERVPIDPFDGNPIRYRHTEPGYILYSILEDGQDNGGRERGDVKSGEPYDWSFIVTR